MLNHANGVLRTSSLFRALHISAATKPRATKVIPSKTGKKFPKYYLQPTLKSHFNIQSFKHKTNTDKTLPKPEYNTAHKTLWAQTGKTQRSQQHKTNMANHRSLKRTLLQAEIQKTSQKQDFTYSDSKQNGKELSDLLPSANIGKRISNIHESTRRFNAASRKNPKEHFKVSLCTQTGKTHTPPRSRQKPKTKTRRARTKADRLTEPTER